MNGTVVKGGYLLSGEEVKANWGVRVEGDSIVKIAPNNELIVQRGDRLIEALDKLVAPGFINGHMHMYGVLSHGISVDAAVSDFSDFLEDFWWPYVENRIDHRLIEVTSRWACVEMIKSGVTSFLEVLEGPNSIPGALELEKKVIEAAGLRAWLSFEACERVSGENGRLGLKENADFIRENNSSNNLVQGLMSIHTLFTGNKSFVMRAKELAGELDVDIHMHLSESTYEPGWVEQKYGKSPVELYDEWGYLDKRVIASQAVQLDPSEVKTIAQRRCRVIHMPLSNCEVGGGVAPVPDYLDYGVPTGLGTDGYINNFFEVMRGAFLIHKAYRRKPEIMPAQMVYQMATSRGAAAVGCNQVGALKEGYKADLITINLDTPTPVNEKNVYDQLVLFRNPEDVAEVMVNGRLLKQEGRLLTIDENSAKEDLRGATEEFWKMK